MAIHESTVNFKKLVRNLAEMYNFPVQEVVLVELIANSLDAKATVISINYDSSRSVLVISDNGNGMSKDQFRQYHDFAADLKSRGDGIGFAGLGAKIAFNCCNRIITETRSEEFEGSSVWFLDSRNKLVWEDNRKVENLLGCGTRVEIHFSENYAKPFENDNYIEEILVQHYLPLFEKKFLEFYKKIDLYSDSLKVLINGKEINKFNIESRFRMEKVHPFFLSLKGKKYGVGVFGLTEKDYVLGEDKVGIGISVFGKLVKFDFFNQFVDEISSRILGIVEIPVLIEFLNTSKSDFIKGKQLHRKFNKYYEPIRAEFKKWLTESGIKSFEFTKTEDAIKLEQEIKKVIRELPELNELFSKYVKSKLAVKSSQGEIKGRTSLGGNSTIPVLPGSGRGETGPLEPGKLDGKSFDERENGEERAKPISRARRGGIRISFYEEPGRSELAWIEGDIVIINIGHSSYKKIKGSKKMQKLHHLFSVALCLERRLKEESVIDNEKKFVEQFMYLWGKV